MEGLGQFALEESEEECGVTLGKETAKHQLFSSDGGTAVPWDLTSASTWARSFSVFKQSPAGLGSRRTNGLVEVTSSSVI